MRDEDVQRNVAAIRAQFGTFQPFPQLVRLLAEGEPVAVERLAAAGGWSVDQTRADLAGHPSVEWDGQGRIEGLGVTLRPTPHRFTFDGRTLFGWCATDALMFPVLLDQPGTVESTCPVTGRRVRVDVTPGAVLCVEPSGAVVSEVRPTERVADVRADICGLGHFFSSREAAAGWLAQYPQGQLNLVIDDFEIHRKAMAQLGWVGGGDQAR